MRRLTFFDAPCVALAFQLDAKGQGKQAASGLRLRFSPAAVQFDGVFVELYSRLHWEKDAAIRRRALVNPFLLPQLVPPPVAPPRLVPPGLPSLPPVAPLVGAAVGLAALLLTPANDADAPGYDAEKAFGRLNSPLLSDAQRLAFLERELAHRILNPQEQAQYEDLLAKVKGIHGAEPALVTVSPEFEGEVPMEQSDLGRMALAFRKAKEKDNWHEGNVTVFEYEDENKQIFYLIAETNPAVTQRHAERIALEKLQAEGIPSQNIKRIYSELEPCETPDGGKHGDGCKSMIKEEAPNAKVTYSFQYRGSGVSTRPERIAAMRRKAKYFEKYQK